MYLDGILGNILIYLPIHDMSSSFATTLGNPRQEHCLNWRACDQYKVGQPRHFVASRWPVDMRLFVVPEMAEGF